MKSSIKASAILAVYNAENTLKSCLDSLVNQSVPIEVIVVDDGSTDRTDEIINSYPKIKLLTQNHAGPAMARNLGAKHVTADILLFVDADMVFDKDYVKKLIEPIQQKKVVGTYTFEERVANWDNFWARCWNYQEGWEDKKRFPPPPAGGPPQYGTDFRAILKSEFERVGGFDNIGYTDTWTLFKKLGTRPLATHAICYHKNPDSLSSVYHQARWSAKRPYKFGFVGTLYALVRTSLPVSIIVGVYKSLVRRELRFLIFKLVYDWGRFIGIINLLLTGNKAK